jgi:hypothetical protein
MSCPLSPTGASSYDLGRLALFTKSLMLASEYSPVPVEPRARELLVGALEGVASRVEEVVVDQDSVRPARWVTVTVNEQSCTLSLERVDAPWTVLSGLREAMSFVQGHLAPPAPGEDHVERLRRVEISATNGMLKALDGRSELLDVETYRSYRARVLIGQNRTTLDAGTVHSTESTGGDGALIAPPVVESSRTPAGPAVGYVWLGWFGPGVSAELERGLARLEAAQVKGLVLDLRDNPGGLLDEAIKVADIFIKTGTLGTMVKKERGREQRKDFFARNSGHEPEGALVVLVNRRTASGSELVAAAIKNLGRGVILGEPTAGAASIVEAFDLAERHSRPARDPSRDVVQDIIDGKSPTVPPAPSQPVHPVHDENSPGLLLVTGTLVASGGAPIEGSGLVPDIQPTCLVREPPSAGNDCLIRFAQEAIARARDAQRPSLLSAANAINAPAQPSAGAP